MSGYTFQGYAIPEHMVQALEGYTEEGHPLGHFLQAIVSNNFMEACSRADMENQRNLPAYGAYLYNMMPAASWGSPGAYKHWVECGGAKGLREGRI